MGKFGGLWCVLVLAVASGLSSSAEAQEKTMGGHVGVAIPFVTVAKNTTSVADEAVIATPIGVGFQLTESLKVDFETVVLSHVSPKGSTGLMVDPGLIYNFGPLATGLRVAFKIGQPANIGVIPLVNVPLVKMAHATWFAEGAFPIFYANDGGSLTVALHTGLGF